MNAQRLILRGIAFHWRSHAASMLSVAVATMVMAGALLVGESVRGSLAEAALRRLGQIESAMQASQPFRSGLADQIPGAAAVLTLEGVAENPEGGLQVPNVQVVGCDANFEKVFGDSLGKIEDGEVVLNAALASDLGARSGDEILLRVRRPNAADATLFRGRRRGDALASVRCTIARVLPRRGIGEFSLVQPTTPKRTLFVRREWLADRIGQPSRANAILVQGGSEGSSATGGAVGRIQLEDLGLRLVGTRSPDRLVLVSDRIVLDAQVVEAAVSAGGRAGCTPIPVSVNLAASLRKAGNDHPTVSYATVAAYDPAERVGASIQPGEALPTAWLVQALALRPGDRLQVSVLKPGGDGSYVETWLPDPLQVVEPPPIGAPRPEPALTPQVPGVTDADTVGDWRPPFPVDMRRVTQADEDYWKAHRAAPKLYVHPSTMARLWELSGEPGNTTTGLMLAWPRSPGAEERFVRALLEEMGQRSLLPAFRPVRDQALEASQGSTDFAGLFFGLGLFVVLAGMGLAYGVVHHMVERRASESGMLLALGCHPTQVRLWLLAETLVVAVAGSLAGVALSIPYAGLVVRHLGSVWGGESSSVALRLHVGADPLLSGFALGLIVGLAAGWWACRRIAIGPVLPLLSGWQSRQAVDLESAFARTRALSTLVLAPLLALAALGAVLAPGWRGSLVPALAIVASLLFVVLLQTLLLRRTQSRPASSSLGGIVLRNLAVRRRGAWTTAGVLACATLVLVVAAANRRNALSFGALDYDLVARVSVPLPVDPSTEAGRRSLGFSEDAERLLRRSTILAFPASPGEDASCANLARPASPRLVGLTRAQQETLLDGSRLPEARGDVFPAAGNADTVKWQLHSGLGRVFEFVGPDGRRAKLRFVQLLSTGLFAGDLLVSEHSLRRLYPDAQGTSVLLVRCPGASNEVARTLRTELADFGIEVRTTREAVQTLADVQNLYLGAFLALGSLGVLLGITGVALGVLRNAEDQRHAHALMLSLGIGRRAVGTALALEQILVLTAGLALGLASAVFMPGMREQIDWAGIGISVLAALGVGTASAVLAARAAARACSVRDLRRE